MNIFRTAHDRALCRLFAAIECRRYRRDTTPTTVKKPVKKQFLRLLAILHHFNVNPERGPSSRTQIVFGGSAPFQNLCVRLLTLHLPPLLRLEFRPPRNSGIFKSLTSVLTRSGQLQRHRRLLCPSHLSQPYRPHHGLKLARSIASVRVSYQHFREKSLFLSVFILWAMDV